MAPENCILLQQQNLYKPLLPPTSMTLTSEEVSELKAQLSQQIAHLPAEQRAKAQQQIGAMSPEALETMLNQQRGASSNAPGSGKGGEKTVFRMMVEKEIETVIVEENPEALAILDINPISQGHTIVIPKEAVASQDKLPPQAFTLAQKVAKLAKDNLEAKSTEIQTETKFGEAIIHVIPIYDTLVNLQSPRKKSSLEELKELVKKIKPEEKPKILKIEKESNPQLPLVKRSRRIP